MAAWAAFLSIWVASCHAAPVSLTAQTTPATGPAMVHFPQIVSRQLQKMNSTPSERNSRTWLSDFAFSEIKGKEMTSGLFHMKSGPALNYTYAYEEMKYIVSGEFHLTDGTGQKLVAKAGDLVHFPRNTRVIFETPNEALGWYTGQRAGAATGIVGSLAEGSLADGKMEFHSQIAAHELPKMMATLSEKNSNTFFEDFETSLVPHKALTTGLFHMKSGPALNYTYAYEEMKYIVSGEFHLTDGTGQKLVAKAGDLMYFPKGTQMIFEAPDVALGCFTGQRIPFV